MHNSDELTARLVLTSNVDCSVAAFAVSACNSERIANNSSEAQSCD